MNKLSIGVRLAFGFAVILIMFIVVSTVIYYNAKKMHEDNHWVDFTYQVLDQADKIVSNLASAESAQRSYIITGDENYFVSFN